MRKRAPLRFRNDDDRSLYFALNPESGRVKIGISALIEARLSGLEKAVGTPLKLLAAFPLLAPYEEHLHEAFVDSRHFGEWFNRTPSLDGLIAELLRLKDRPDDQWAYLLEFIAWAEDLRRSGHRLQVHAPPGPPIPKVNPPIALLKDAQQLILLVAGEPDGEISDSLETVEFSGLEVRDLWRLIRDAVTGLEAERERRREILKLQLRLINHPQVQDLGEIERTLQQLAAGPDAIIEEVPDAAR